jgi:hypothetical protein
MRNTEQIWISDGTNLAYLALDAADGLVQCKSEEGPDASVDAPRGVMHMRSIHTGSNLMVTCRDHSSTFHQHQPLQNESIQVRVRSMPTGKVMNSNRPHQTGP